MAIVQESDIYHLELSPPPDEEIRNVTNWIKAYPANFPSYFLLAPFTVNLTEYPVPQSDDLYVAIHYEDPGLHDHVKAVEYLGSTVCQKCLNLHLTC